jgi:hypothetical protein
MGTKLNLRTSGQAENISRVIFIFLFKLFIFALVICYDENSIKCKKQKKEQK